MESALNYSIILLIMQQTLFAIHVGGVQIWFQYSPDLIMSFINFVTCSSSSPLSFAPTINRAISEDITRFVCRTYIKQRIKSHGIKHLEIHNTEGRVEKKSFRNINHKTRTNNWYDYLSHLFLSLPRSPYDIRLTVTIHSHVTTSKITHFTFDAKTMQVSSSWSGTLPCSLPLEPYSTSTTWLFASSYTYSPCNNVLFTSLSFLVSQRKGFTLTSLISIRRVISVSAVFEDFTKRVIKAIVLLQREAKALGSELIFTTSLVAARGWGGLLLQRFSRVWWCHREGMWGSTHRSTYSHSV